MTRGFPFIFGSATVLISTITAPPSAPAQQRTLPSVNATPEQDARARQLYLEGEAHYAAGRYRDAAQSFERAYALSLRAALLFNLGNAYERMGDLRRAATYLRRYLASPAARGQQLIRQRIERIEATRVAQQKARDKDKRATTRAAPPARGRLARPLSETTPRASQLAAYILLGVGAAGFVAAVTLGVLSRGAARDAETSCAQTGYCTRDAEADLDREKRFALTADLALGLGVAATGVGAALLVLHALAGRQRAERAGTAGLRRLSVLASPTRGGAEVGLAGSF